MTKRIAFVNFRRPIRVGVGVFVVTWVGRIRLELAACGRRRHWNTVAVGSFLLVEAYEVVDPETFTDAYNDRWLQNYATTLIKEQWGSNLTKFSGMTLPGGVQFNGEKIYDDAVAERRKLEDEMISSYSLPVLDMIG